MIINWITIRVKDYEKSKDFYGNFLGLHLENEFSPNGEMKIVFYSADNGMQIELILSNDTEYSNQGVSIGICAMEYEELLEKARAQKMLASEPTIIGGHMECFFLTDPNGVGIQIIKA